MTFHIASALKFAAVNRRDGAVDRHGRRGPVAAPGPDQFRGIIVNARSAHD